MTKSTQGPPGRVSKREFISRVAKRSDVSVKVASAVYEGLIEELICVVSSGDRLTLTGFGKFYPQQHKGHKVRFAGPDLESGSKIDDYTVLKFSATREVNRLIGSNQCAPPQT